MPDDVTGLVTRGTLVDTFFAVQTTPPYNDKYLSQRYLCWTMAQTRYMLGANTQSMVIGVGSNYPKHVQDRGAACPSAPTNCSAVNSLYNPQPDPHTLNGALVYVSPTHLVATGMPRGTC